MLSTTEVSAGPKEIGRCARTSRNRTLNATRTVCDLCFDECVPFSASSVSAGTSFGTTSCSHKRSVAGCAFSCATVGSRKYWKGNDATCVASNKPGFSSRVLLDAASSITSSTRFAALAKRSISVVVPSDFTSTASVAASLKQSARRRLVSMGATTRAFSAAVRTKVRDSGVIAPETLVSVLDSSSASSRVPHCFRKQLRAKVAAARRRVGAHVSSQATPRSAMLSPAASFVAAVSSFAVASSRAVAWKDAMASRAMPSFSGFGVLPGAPELICFALSAAASASGATAVLLVASVRGIKPQG